MIDPGIEGKVALITGANSRMGIGAATARAFAEQGAKVFLTYLRTDSGAAEVEEPGAALYESLQGQSATWLVEEIRQAGGQAEALEFDLARHEDIPALFDRVETSLGAVEILVNNAAHSTRDSFLAQTSEGEERDLFTVDGLTAESHDRHFAANSRGTALMMAEFARRHVARGADWGRMINISTDAAGAFPGEISYGASKYALESYSRSAAIELGRYGITVNIISPGPIQTGWITPELETLLVEDTPLGRIGQPTDIADVVLFLASEGARWLTGQLIYVGGGHRMHT